MRASRPHPGGHLAEHFDSLSQTCMAPSNTSTASRRLAWPRRTLRRPLADLHGPIEHFDGLSQTCMAPSNTSTASRRLAWPRRTLRRPLADLQGLEYIISGRRRFYNPRNTLFLVAADFTTLEIHYFWPPQICMASKYIISGRRRFYNARNTLFLVAADLHGLEIHYFWLPWMIRLLFLRPSITH